MPHMIGSVLRTRDTAVNKMEKKSATMDSILYCWRDKDKKRNKTDKYIVFCKVKSIMEKNKIGQG